MRRTTMLLVVSLLTAPHHLSAQASLDRQFQAREETIVAALKDKRYDTFRDMIDPGFSSVYASGVQGRGAEVESVKKITTLRSYDISEFKAHHLAPSIVLATYKVKHDLSVGGKDVGGDFWVTTAWRQKGGKWLVVYHSEVQAEAQSAQ